MSAQQPSGGRTSLDIGLMVAGLAGAVACGTMTLYKVMWYAVEDVDGARIFIAHLYVTFFSIIIPSAELGLMEHNEMAMFLLSRVGRAFLYLFMGGLLLGEEVAGCVVGGFMIALSVVNIIAQIAAAKS